MSIEVEPVTIPDSTIALLREIAEELERYKALRAQEQEKVDFQKRLERLRTFSPIPLPAASCRG